MVSKATVTDTTTGEERQPGSTPADGAIIETPDAERTPSQNTDSSSPEETPEAKRLAKAEQTIRQLTGRLQTQQAALATMDGIIAEMRSLKREVRRQQAMQSDDDDVRAQELQSITAEAQADKETQDLLSYQRKIARWLGRDIETVSASYEDEQVKQAIRGLSQAKSLNDVDAVYEEVGEYLAGRQQAAREEERKHMNRQGRTLEAGLGGGSGGAAVGAQELVNRYARGERLTPDEEKRASDALTAGTLPKL